MAELQTSMTSIGQHYLIELIENRNVCVHDPWCEKLEALINDQQDPKQLERLT